MKYLLFSTVLVSSLLAPLTAQWKQASLGGGSVPGPRQGFRMCYLPNTNEVLGYGGATFASSGCGGVGIHPCPAEDPATPGWQGSSCYVYDVATDSWRQPQVPHPIGGLNGSEVPGRRDGHGLVYLDIAGRAILFGGYTAAPCGAPGARMDVYWWEAVGNAVTPRDSFTLGNVFGANGINSNIPGFANGGANGIQRFSMAAIPGTNKVILFGGLSNTTGTLSDRTYLGEWFDAPSFALVWTDITSQVGTLPGAAWNSTLTWGKNSVGQNGFILNDGVTNPNGSTPLGKHFFLPDPSQPILSPWTELLVNGAAVPMGSLNSMGAWSVYDRNRNKMVAFGGGVYGTAPGSTTWSWNLSSGSGYQVYQPQQPIPGSTFLPGIVWIGGQVQKGFMFGGNTGGYFTTNQNYLWESAASVPYGTGCGGASPVVVSSSSPVIPIGAPQAVSLQMSYPTAIAGSTVLFVSGFPDFSGSPDPVSGCLFYLNLSSLVIYSAAPVLANGTATSSWNVPFNLGLQGFEFAWQVALLQPGVPNYLLSNGLLQRLSIF